MVILPVGKKADAKYQQGNESHPQMVRKRRNDAFDDDIAEIVYIQINRIGHEDRLYP